MADWESIGFERVKAERKRIKDSENAQVKERTLDILYPERMPTEAEISNQDWSQLQPAPIIQLSNERANALLRDAGWDGNVERFVDESNLIAADPRQAFQDAGVTDEMWEAARAANDANLSPKKIDDWSKGYLTTHHPSEAFDEFEASREFEIHHRRDDIFIGSVVKALLEKLPRTPQPIEKIGQALIDAAQTREGSKRLAELMKDGSVSPAIAKQVRSIKLGKGATPEQAHFDFVKKFISQHYPARIAKVGDLYQLAAPTDTEQVEAFKRLMQCRIKHKHPDIDPTPENGDLTPPPASDPKAESKELVISMRENGHTYREIAAEVGVSLGTAHSWGTECHIRSEKFLYKAYIENSLNTPSLPESPQTTTTTAFEANSADVTSESNMTSDMTFREQILRLLETGEKQTGEIVDAINGKRVAIMNELKRLCDAGEIVKVKRGIYDLPSRAYSIDLPLESMPDVTVERNGKAFRLHVHRKPGQAEGEAVTSLFPKSKKYTTTMYAIEGGQRSPPTTFCYWVVTDEQEIAKCHAYAREDVSRERTSPIPGG